MTEYLIPLLPTLNFAHVLLFLHWRYKRKNTPEALQAFAGINSRCDAEAKLTQNSVFSIDYASTLSVIFYIFVTLNVSNREQTLKKHTGSFLHVKMCFAII